MVNLQSTTLMVSLVERYAELRAQREKLEAAAKEIKAAEDEAKTRLISEMDVQKIPSAKFEGIGRVVLRQNKRYEISDIELFAKAMLQRMVDNAQNGRRLSDGLMLQKRPAKTIIDELAANESWDAETAFAQRGLAVSENLDITFTKIKGVGNE